MAFHLIETGFVNERTKINITCNTIPNRHFVHPLRELFTEGVYDLLMNKNPVCAHTGLATAPKLVSNQVICSSVQIRILKHNKRCVATQFQSQLFNLVGGI